MARTRRVPELDILTVQETADFLHCSIQHVYNLVAQKRLPVIRLGRALRFSTAELRQFIEGGGTADA